MAVGPWRAAVAVGQWRAALLVLSRKNELTWALPGEGRLLGVGAPVILPGRGLKGKCHHTRVSGHG